MSDFDEAIIQRIRQLEREVERLQRWEQPVGKWQSYTVSWTAATTNPAIGNGTLNGKYVQIGKIITCNNYLLAGSTTTFGSGGFGFSLPITVYSSAVGFVGNFIANDNSANGWYSGQAIVVGGDTKIITFIRDGISSYLSYNTPHVWASGDSLFISLTYEVA